MQDWHKVKKLYKEGIPKKAIARKLNISKNTVKKLLKLEEPPVQKDQKPIEKKPQIQ